MPKQEWIAQFEGHEIKVVNTWSAGATLYIDGECRDSSSHLMAVDKHAPLLSARLQAADNQSHVVEVFIVAWATAKAKICVDGKQIAGDVF